MQDNKLLGLNLGECIGLTAIIGEFHEQGVLIAGVDVLNHGTHLATRKLLFRQIDNQSYWCQQRYFFHVLFPGSFSTKQVVSRAKSSPVLTIQPLLSIAAPRGFSNLEFYHVKSAKPALPDENSLVVRDIEKATP